ncbi:MAG: hypothetical protein OEU32_03895 [Acidimicrobiia bacterium]|nr:hypothetical protein [Acidimicrobiia bacterium]
MIQLVTALLVLSGLALVDPAGGQEISSSSCILAGGRLPIAEGSNGEWLEAGGFHWRLSLTGQTLTAYDPDSLEPTIERRLGTTDDTLLTGLSVVDDWIVVSISGPERGGIQLLDARTGESPGSIEIGRSADPESYRMVTDVVTVGEYAYVAGGRELVIIELAALDGGDPERAVVERSRLPVAVGRIGATNDTIHMQQFLGTRSLMLDPATDILTDADSADAPWNQLVVDDRIYAVTDGRIGEIDPTTGNVSSEVAVIGEVRSVVGTSDVVWIASQAPSGDRLVVVDPATGDVLATMFVDDPIHAIWATSEAVIVETTDEARWVEHGSCG